jgi:hypothetical protein
LAFCSSIFARASFFSPGANFNPFYPLFDMFSLLFGPCLWYKISSKTSIFHHL